MAGSDVWHWLQTVGAPTPDDPRNGELHQMYVSEMPEYFDLEPWDEDPDSEDPAQGDARYFKVDAPPVRDQEGRLIWLYEYRRDSQG